VRLVCAAAVCLSVCHAAGSWVPQMLELANAEDCLGSVDRAVSVTAEQVRDAAPDVVLFAMCGLPLEATAREARALLAGLRQAWSAVPAVAARRLLAMDGVHVFSRPGPWLVQSMESLVEALHPDAPGFGHRGKLWCSIG
jgi:iron complex transport system substrate-binding protein